ncbi:MAG: hypothetical protein WC980_04105 [Candidatus Brocadiia bacterium]
MDFSGRKSGIKAFTAVNLAMAHMAAVLFKPFNPVRWLKFGVIGFLVYMGQGGFNINVPWQGDTNKWAASGPPDFNHIFQWCKDNMAIIIAVAAAIVLLITVVWIVWLYLSSRFSFVLIDGVVKKDLRIREYYRARRAEGWSYFLWRMGFLGVILPVVLIAAVPAAVAIFFIIKQFSVGLLLLVIASILFFLAVLILSAIVGMLTDDFVLPIMTLFGLKSMKAWGVLWSLIKSDTKSFIYYLLVKLLMAICAAIAAITVSCLIMALAMLPGLAILGLITLAQSTPLLYIIIVPLALVLMVFFGLLTQTVFAPITVFFRSFSLLFLEGFGPEFLTVNRPQSNISG